MDYWMVGCGGFTCDNVWCGRPNVNWIIYPSWKTYMDIINIFNEITCSEFSYYGMGALHQHVMIKTCLGA